MHSKYCSYYYYYSDSSSSSYHYYYYYYYYYYDYDYYYYINIVDNVNTRLSLLNLPLSPYWYSGNITIYIPKCLLKKYQTSEPV